MTTVELEEAQSHLAELVSKAVNGESFVIADGGRPLVQVTAVQSPADKPNLRTGFLDGQFLIPDDFDTMHQQEIIDMFEGKE